MSRSQIAYFAIAGVIGATMLVTPLVNWTGGEAPLDLSNGYDAQVSDAGCGETSSELALMSRPVDDTLKVSLANEEEVAFLEGLQPAGGNSYEEGTGEGGADGVFNQYAQEVDPPPDDQSQNGTNGGTGDGAGGTTGGTGTPQIARLNPDGTDPLLDPNNGGGTCTPGVDCEQTGQCTPGVDCDDDKKDHKSKGGCPVGAICLADEDSTAVPEPASLGLLAFGIGLLAVRRRRSA